MHKLGWKKDSKTQRTNKILKSPDQKNSWNEKNQFHEKKFFFQTQNESTRNFYAQQMSSMAPKPDENDASKQLNVNAPTFQPNPNIPSSNGGNILNQLFQNASIVPSGEVMVGSGKYSGPTQPHGKSYYKDEIFIRNADSGKGKGITI